MPNKNNNKKDANGKTKPRTSAVQQQVAAVTGQNSQVAVPGLQGEWLKRRKKTQAPVTGLVTSAAVTHSVSAMPAQTSLSAATSPVVSAAAMQSASAMPVQYSLSAATPPVVSAAVTQSASAMPVQYSLSAATPPVVSAAAMQSVSAMPVQTSLSAATSPVVSAAAMQSASAMPAQTSLSAATPPVVSAAEQREQGQGQVPQVSYADLAKKKANIKAIQQNAKEMKEAQQRREKQEEEDAYKEYYKRAGLRPADNSDVNIRNTARYYRGYVNSVLRSRNKETYNYGNFAVALVNIDGLRSYYYADSQIDQSDNTVSSNLPDISLKPNNPRFKFKLVNNKGEVKSEEEAAKEGNIDDAAYARDVDTEMKIIDHISKELDGKVATGSITLFTEKPPCKSCQYVIGQFLVKYPNIKLQVIHNGGDRA